VCSGAPRHDAETSPRTCSDARGGDPLADVTVLKQVERVVKGEVVVR
jgi:hypothetical protein